MALTDSELLDFDAGMLERGRAGDARLLLRDHGDVFRAQLIAARWLEGLRDRRSRVEQLRTGEWQSHHQAGWNAAMNEIIVRLRQGDFLPGGRLYED